MRPRFRASIISRALSRAVSSARRRLLFRKPQNVAVLSRPKGGLHLQDLPEDLLVIIIRYYAGISRGGLLELQSLGSVRSAFALCSLSKSLYSAYLTLFSSVHVEARGDRIVDSSFAALFGSHLRHISLEGPCDSGEFLKKLRDSQPSICTFSLRNACLAPSGRQVIVEMLHHSTSSLRAVSLHRPCCNMQTLARDIAPALKNVSEISIAHAMLQHSDLLAMTAEAGDCLTSLALEDLTHDSVNDSTLLTLSKNCPNLENVRLRRINTVSGSGKRNFALALKNTLKRIEFDAGFEYIIGTVVNGKLMKEITTKCQNLTHLNIDARFLSGAEANEALIPLSNRLQSLRVNLRHNFSRQDIHRMGEHLRQVSELHVQQGICVMRFFDIVEVLASQLRVLTVELGELQIADAGFSAVTKCEKLRHVKFYSAMPAVSICVNGYMHNMEKYWPTKIAIDNMLKGCGKELRSFTLILHVLPAVRTGDQSFQPNPREMLLDGPFLAESLRRHCRKLEYVHVQGMDVLHCGDDRLIAESRAAFDKIRYSRNGATVLSDPLPVWLVSHWGCEDAAARMWE